MRRRSKKTKTKFSKKKAKGGKSCKKKEKDAVKEEVKYEKEEKPFHMLSEMDKMDYYKQFFKLRKPRFKFRMKKAQINGLINKSIDIVK